MNTDTGIIILPEEMEKLRGQFLAGEISEAELSKYTQMKIPPTPVQLARSPMCVGRNDPCPCRSGKKFKKCCYTG